MALSRGVSQFCRAGRFAGQLQAVVLRFWDAPPDGNGAHRLGPVDSTL